MSFLQVRPKTNIKIDIHREMLTQESLVRQSQYVSHQERLTGYCRTCCATWSLLRLITNLIPILGWLPWYSCRRYFINDLIAGCTLGIICIPHGLAYGLLAGVDPSNGLYVGIVPPLVYVILGTSRHASIGTFAVISIMTYKVVQEHTTDDEQPGEKSYTALQVVTATAVMTGIVHILMAIMNLGALSTLMSDPLVSGFTSAAATYVVTAQLKEATGIETPRHKGFFRNIVIMSQLVELRSTANHVTVLLCLFVMAFMIIMNEYVGPRVVRRCHFPIPSPFIAIILGTMVSNWFDLHGNYGVRIIGPIPMGLPSFAVPPMDLLPAVIYDAIAIGIVSYTLTISMGLTFARKFSYEIRPNQELFAIGMGNVIGGFFSCYPLGCSLARSVIQASTGGVTQIATVVSVSIVVMTVLWIGSYLTSLPKCVLSAVIIVALKPMFVQIKDSRIFFRQGWLEFMTWFVTFSMVLFVDITLGLFAGVCVSVLRLQLKCISTYYALLGTFPGGDGIYVDIDHHLNSVEVKETKIFRYTGSLSFATKLAYQKSLYKAVGIDYELMQRADRSESTEMMWATFRILVLDFSSLDHLDVAGCEQLTEINSDMQRLGIQMFLASPSDKVYDVIIHSQKFRNGPFDVFATVHDAVEYGNACRAAR